MCATIIAVGASAAVSAYAAHKGAEASKNAAKTQQDSAAEALRVQQDRYKQAREDFSPYAQAGATSLGRLSGMSAQPRQQFDPSKPGGGFQFQPPGAPQTQNLAKGTPFPSPVGPQGPPQATGQPQMPMGQSGPMPPPNGAQGPPQPAGDMVTMQFNGQTGPVPRALVPLLTARGGKVLGG